MSGWLRTRFGLGLLSIAGTTAGHYLSYWFVAPDSHHREELLESTGHAGESPFLVLSIAALLATCIAILGGRPRKHPSGLSGTFLRLAAMQTTAFIVLEGLERIFEGTSPIAAIQEPVVWLGLAAQLVIAVVGAGLLRALQRAAAVVGASRPQPKRSAIFVAVDGTIVLFSRPSSRPWKARGPPGSS